MKIALLEPIGISKEALGRLSAGLKERGHEFVAYDAKTTDPEELIARSAGCQVVMIANNPYPEAVVRACPDLKLLDIAFTGIDHVAQDALKEQGVTICNAAGYSDETVAELAIGMAIDALRNVAKANDLVRKGGTSAGIGGREICGRTVGIVGLGRIGLRTAQLFQAFGAKVIACNRSQNPKALEMGIEYKSLDEVLSQSDIISLHLPNNKETRGFISREKIALMKPDAVFINCARGPIVDNAALADALNEDKLGFACADVFDMEPPLPEDYPLLHAKNTLLTPHQAFISEESMLRRAEIVFNNVYAWLDDKPINVCK
ncbi:MAG: 2-hydroxyacid dehydrogenase [Oscillospiraceae bacterium]|nr:2-hydroxyacid dehydrogenase [Oscillospiraceae bacterium]